MARLAEAANSAKVIDDYIAHWNARIGETKPVGVHRKSHRDYVMSNRHVTDDLIRHFAISNGDTNPLWRYEDYAAKSPWGRITAPPMQIIAIAGAAALPPPPAVKDWSLMQAGAMYVVERPFLPGDVIDGHDVWMGIEERSKPNRPNRTFILTSERRCTAQNGNYVGKIVQRVFATTPRVGTSAELATPGPERKRPSYSEEQLKEIYAHYDAENAGKLRRGAEPLFWEDVNEGDNLPLMLKGPVDVLDCASFVASVGVGLGFADKWLLIMDEIDYSPRDPVTNAYHFNMSWHLDDNVARAMGQPYALNFGSLTEINFSHALTNWAGDYAFVRSMDNRMMAPMFLGETLRITGGITNKYEKDGRGLVEIVLNGHQQDGIQVARHQAIVQLPHRGRPLEVVEEVMPE